MTSGTLSQDNCFFCFLWKAALIYLSFQVSIWFLLCFLTQWGGRWGWPPRGRGHCCWSVGWGAERGNRAHWATAPTACVAQRTERGRTFQSTLTWHASQWTHLLRTQAPKHLIELFSESMAPGSLMKLKSDWNMFITSILVEFSVDSNQVYRKSSPKNDYSVTPSTCIQTHMSTPNMVCISF